MAKKKQAFLSDAEFHRWIAARLAKFQEDMNRLAAQSKRDDIEAKRVWVKPHTVPTHKVGGHYRVVLPRLRRGDK